MKLPGKKYLSCIFLHFCFVAGQGQNGNQSSYTLSRKTGGPVIFAKDIISTDTDEFGGVFSPDGKIVYFSKSVPGSYFYSICYSEFKNGHWTKPGIMPFSGIYKDFDPVLSPDGNKMLFASDRPVDGKTKTDYDIWMVEKTKTGWSNHEHLDTVINSSYDEHFASIAGNGNIYFSSTRPGAKGGEYDSDVYLSRFINGKYQQAESLGDSVNSEYFELEAVIAPDESYLLTGVLGRPDGFGHFDIYISHNKNGDWSTSKNMGKPINSSARDYSPRITPDRKYIFFTSERDFSLLRDKKDNAYNYDQYVKEIRGVYNGLGNIYQLEFTDFLKQDK